MTEKEFRDILKKYEEGTCSREERLMVEAWFAYRAHSASWDWNGPEHRKKTKKLIFRRIIETVVPVNDDAGKRLVRRGFIAIAASLLIAAGGWVAYQKAHEATSEGNAVAFHNKQSDWAGPGSKVALLTLSDGKTVRLDELEKEQAFMDDGMLIKSEKAGQLSYYHGNGRNAHASVLWNTIKIPFGSQYKISLPDGTLVWLNSASSLKYPTHFTGNKRSVILDGEAYFDVAKKVNSPFVVETGFTSVEATGTAFNLKAYADEHRVQTTLVEGSVNVRRDHAVINLKPGQQAISSVNDDKILINRAELANVTAWREGYFVFDDLDIRSIMKCIERWYNIDVVFSGTLSPQRFGGTFTMGKDIAELLHYLEQISHLSFKIEGRRVTVEDKS